MSQKSTTSHIRLSAPLLAIWRWFLTSLARRRDVARDARIMSRLSDRDLRDIGLSRRELRRPFR
jgi:uncharacterized protein YjiS (DUF1127 family)